MADWPVTAIILAGGFGTRLRQVVTDRPKPLAEVDGKPFLFLVLKQLAREGVRRCVLSTGFMADLVEKTLGQRFETMELLYSPEDSPLGTGGALKKALPFVDGDAALVLNGDSYCDLKLRPFFSWHLSHPKASSLALLEISDTTRYGRVETDSEERIVAFREKGIGGAGLMNSGIYLIPRDLLLQIPDTTPCSLEKEVFPAWAQKRILYGYLAQVEKFIDIGTPESYQAAQELLRGL